MTWDYFTSIRTVRSPHLSALEEAEALSLNRSTKALGIGKFKKEADGLHIVQAVPGAKADDVKLEVDEKELSYTVKTIDGIVDQRISVPPNYDLTKISASCRDGVLTIVVPFKPEAQKRTIKVSS